jgi:hypothetical protein
MMDISGRLLNLLVTLIQSLNNACECNGKNVCVPFS